MDALLISSDLMATSKADGAAARTGVALRSISPGGAVPLAEAESPRLIIMDLTAPIVDIAQLVTDLRAAASEARIIAFGPHVHEVKLQAAQDAGCDQVLARGQFHKQIDQLLLTIKS